MVYYAEPMIVNHDLSYLASGCESWCIILSQWLSIMMCYDEPVAENHSEALVVNHGMLF